ncbi:hypothetical protein MMMDOFMJ_3552 [Methylobacterium gnaphalii]|nr:hypothetical protein MMMDOFMJ_3552 [Methylobacterium gnaphalii]
MDMALSFRCRAATTVVTQSDATLPASHRLPLPGSCRRRFHSAPAPNSVARTVMAKLLQIGRMAGGAMSCRIGVLDQITGSELVNAIRELRQ